jgi:hypothetical protein
MANFISKLLCKKNKEGNTWKTNSTKYRVPKTQMEAVIFHLEDNGSITSFEAFKEYGISRLSGIIYDLRHKKNMNIVSQDIQKINRYGNIVIFSKYTYSKTGLGK